VSTVLEGYEASLGRANGATWPLSLIRFHAIARSSRRGTRSGRPCQSPSVNGKKRCRMHGGALGSGAPRGNKNALKHGRHTREAIAERQQIRELVREARKLLLQIE
jgi:hypothetical protein